MLEVEATEGFADVSGAMPEREVGADLRSVVTGLGGLSGRFADEFLALATVLQSNSQRARQIAAGANKATGAESFARSSDSIEVLHKMVLDAAAVSQMVEVSTDRMEEILSRVGIVLPHLRSLSSLHLRLRIVSVLSRIEGGRLTGSDVDIESLAADIDRLSEDVNASVESLLDESTVLAVALGGGVKRLKQHAAEEKSRAAELERCTETVLGPARVQLEASTANAHQIHEQFLNFQRAADRIVMSLQSEDLARQQVEHVQEALRLADEELAKPGAAEALDGIFALQLEQLNGTKELLTGSMASIHVGLQELGPVITQLIERTAEQAHKASAEAEALAVLIEHELKFIEETFQSCSNSVRAILSIVDAAMPSIERMAQGISALRSVSSDVQMISLNATVKTAHLGAGGEAMGILATELHTIILNSTDDIQQVFRGLEAISAALADMTAVRAKSEGSLLLSSGSTGEIDRVLHELAGVIRSSGPEMSQSMEEVERLAGLLGQDLMAGAEIASHRDQLAAVCDHQLQAMTDTFAGLGYRMVAPPVTARESTELSRRLMRMYTMESERVLHVRFFAEEQSGDAGATADDSDVELF